MIFDAVPRPNARTSPNAACANVGCWIDRPTLEEAIAVARSMIANEGWIVGDLKEAQVVNESDYPASAPGRSYFQQALIDKEVIVFCTYTGSGHK